MAQAAAVALENLTGHARTVRRFRRPAQADRAGRSTGRPGSTATNWDAIERDLVGACKTADRDVVRRAAVALGHVGGDAARAALRDYVARERDDNPYPEWLKGHRGDGARFNSLSPANPRTLQAATRALGYLKDADSRAPAGRDPRPQQRPADGQPVPGRGGRRGPGTDRHARGRGRA